MICWALGGNRPAWSDHRRWALTGHWQPLWGCHCSWFLQLTFRSRSAGNPCQRRSLFGPKSEPGLPEKYSNKWDFTFAKLMANCSIYLLSWADQSHSISSHEEIKMDTIYFLKNIILHSIPVRFNYMEALFRHWKKKIEKGIATFFSQNCKNVFVRIRIINSQFWEHRLFYPLKIGL